MLCSSNTKVEINSQKVKSMRHEKSDGVHAADRTQVPMKTSVKQ